jgi:hypothetical protein
MVGPATVTFAARLVKLPITSSAHGSTGPGHVIASACGSVAWTRSSNRFALSSAAGQTRTAPPELAGRLQGGAGLGSAADLAHQQRARLQLGRSLFSGLGCRSGGAPAGRTARPARCRGQVRQLISRLHPTRPGHRSSPAARGRRAAPPSGERSATGRPRGGIRPRTRRRRRSIAGQAVEPK